MQPRFIFAITLVAALAACNEQGSSDAEGDGGPSDDAGGDAGDGGDQISPWEGVAIDSANAPDERSVRVLLDGDPDPEAAGSAESYELDSEAGALSVEGVEYDADTGLAILETERQKLGIEYTLKVVEEGEPVDGLEEQFLAADTAALWVYDFTDPYYNKYEVVADRIEVGAYCTIYVEQGMWAEGTAEAAALFDEAIYPIETELFTEPPDLDGNGRILLLGLDGGQYYGGYFDPTNAYPDDVAMSWWGTHSNEMEMVHINVAAGDFDYTGHVVPHEFQHLLYHERHGLTDHYWTYHDEGLAECAVHAVHGANGYAVDFYLWDYQGLIAGGLSLVNWTYALYENYALAYMFWTYLASRLGGVDAYGDVFDLDHGSPSEANAFIEDALGSDFNTVQMEGLIAGWVRDPTGPYGFEGMVSFTADHPPTVNPGTTSVDLEPFAGTFFTLSEESVDYPGTEGENIVYAGIDGAGAVDLEAPFDVSGGALLVYNSHFEWGTFEPEHSGPDMPASGWKGPGAAAAPVSPAWTDPPPVTPDRIDLLERWREAAEERIAAEAGW